MMWKTLIFLAVASVVLAGKINDKRHANYEFHIKHDYDYHKHHEKLEHHEPETQENAEDDKKEEEIKEETEQANESETNESEANESEANESEGNDSEDSNNESEEAENNEENNSSGYEFFYKVIDSHTHDKKGHHEKKHGDEVKGVYWLLQPDGYKRTVDYHADKHNGFQAKVDYTKSELPEEDHSDAKSEYYVKTYHGAKKYIPVNEEQGEDQEQDKQEESAQHIPIYVI